MKTHHTTHRPTREPEEAGAHLAEAAQELIAGTAHIAEEKVLEARRRLTAAIEKRKEAWEAMQEKAIAGAKVTDQIIRENPYKAIATAVGLGVIIGYLLRRRD